MRSLAAMDAPVATPAIRASTCMPGHPALFGSLGALFLACVAATAMDEDAGPKLAGGGGRVSRHVNSDDGRDDDAVTDARSFPCVQIREPFRWRRARRPYCSGWSRVFFDMGHPRSPHLPVGRGPCHGSDAFGRVRARDTRVGRSRHFAGRSRSAQRLEMLQACALPQCRPVH